MRQIDLNSILRAACHVAGCSVAKAKGRCRRMPLPSLEYGFFRSERDAVLYFTGLLLENESLFSEAACEAVKKLRDQQRQASIFFSLVL